MNIAYFASPAFAVQLGTALLEEPSCNISLVVTRPDRAAGKHLSLAPSPVKEWALRQSYDVFDTSLQGAGEDVLVHELQKRQIELGIVFAYGALLSAKILYALRHGCWNLHPSLLPLYRGPSPVSFPLIMEDSRTGISVMKMDTRMDTGNILMQKETVIQPDETQDILTGRLIRLAAQPLQELIAQTAAGRVVQEIPQDPEKATWTRKLTREDGYIQPEFIQKALNHESISAVELPAIRLDYLKRHKKVPAATYDASHVLYALYRGLHPWPGVWTMIPVKGKLSRLKVLKMTTVNDSPTIQMVQLEGKKPVDFLTFKQAYNIL